MLEEPVLQEVQLRGPMLHKVTDIIRGVHLRLVIYYNNLNEHSLSKMGEGTKIRPKLFILSE